MLVETRPQLVPDCTAPDSSSLPIRLITHNIRYATRAPFPGEEPWATRCPRLCAQLLFNSLHPASTFICLQEVLHEQLLDILTCLRDSDEDWTYIGVGRDDGKKAGELTNSPRYSPIFYRMSVWKLSSWRTIWLSSTPDHPSKGWDAASIRIVTVGSFSHLATNQRIGVLSTHLDDQGAISRKHSAEIIRDLLLDSGTESEKRVPMLLGGDFNSAPDDDAYKILAAPESPSEDVGTMIDSRRRYGHRYTFTGFSGAPNDLSQIDHIFCSKAKPEKTELYHVQSFGVLENKFDDGVYLSDHRAVVADILLKQD